jgi:hypothetical protein
MGPHLAIAFLFVATDALIWLYIMIYHLDRVPKGDPIKVFTRAIIAGIGGVAGAYIIAQVTGANDLLTALVGALIGGRLVGGAIQMFAGGKGEG